MRDDDLSPQERAARNPNYRDGWDNAVSEGRLEPDDVLGRLVSMALSQFGEGQDEWPMLFDDDGFIFVLTAEGRRFDGGISVHVWPDDHPPPHIHILKKSEPDSEYIKIDLETAELVGDLPAWAGRKQLKKMQALLRDHHELFAGWWEKNHGETVTLLA
jgi:hypothetical protein